MVLCAAHSVLLIGMVAQPLLTTMVLLFARSSCIVESLLLYSGCSGIVSIIRVQFSSLCFVVGSERPQLCSVSFAFRCRLRVISKPLFKTIVLCLTYSFFSGGMSRPVSDVDWDNQRNQCSWHGAMSRSLFFYVRISRSFTYFDWDRAQPLFINWCHITLIWLYWLG